MINCIDRNGQKDSLHRARSATHCQAAGYNARLSLFPSPVVTLDPYGSNPRARPARAVTWCGAARIANDVIGNNGVPHRVGRLGHRPPGVHRHGAAAARPDLRGLGHHASVANRHVSTSVFFSSFCLSPRVSGRAGERAWHTQARASAAARGGRRTNSHSPPLSLPHTHTYTHTRARVSGARGDAG